ncbi:MAG: type I-E CRISPR-associated protein Cse1/CasA [Thermodesulfobacteriota bacterium]
MNLVEDPWIPARRRGGAKEAIAPWQITDNFAADPFVELAAPRPDFNGALIQFLIGLLQTCFAPEDGREWRVKRRTPPTSGDLRTAFNQVKAYFDVDRGDKRFLQETALLREKRAVEHPITYLLIDAPTDNTIKKNRDHFVKAADKRFAATAEEGFCLPCAASALFTMQAFAPQGGGGGGGEVHELTGW